MAWYWWIMLVYLTIGLVGTISTYLKEMARSGRKNTIREIKEDLPVFLLITFGWLFLMIGDYLWGRKESKIAEEETKKTVESFFRGRNARK